MLPPISIDITGEPTKWLSFPVHEKMLNKEKKNLILMAVATIAIVAFSLFLVAAHWVLTVKYGR